MPVVEFNQPFSLYRNALYNQGERAMVTDAEAAEIVQQQAGVIIDERSQATKAFSGPPTHKQIKGAPVAK